MARITGAGIEPTDLTGYAARIEQAFRDALGDDINLAPETPQGQLTGVLGLVFTEIEELSLYVANGLNLHAAIDRQLSDYGTLFTLPPRQAEKSTVGATVTGTPGTIIPAGSRARTQANAVFESTARAVIDSSGTIGVLFRAVDFGPVVAEAGQLNLIVNPVAGWVSITNPSAAALGKNAETDSEYRTRYTREIATHSRDSLESVRARVLEVDGVIDCLVVDNSTSEDTIRQGIDIPAAAMYIAVQGGAIADIANAIALTRPAGVQLVGTITYGIYHPRGFQIPITFSRVEIIPIHISVETNIINTFPSDGLGVMRNNLVGWFNGTWPRTGPGIFDQSGIGIGEAIDEGRLRTPLNSVIGHTIQTLVVRRRNAPVASVAVDAGGSGYTSDPEVVFDPPGAEATVRRSGGSITAVNITAGEGGSYATPPTITFEGGGGNGAMATATLGDRTLGTVDLNQRYTLDEGDVEITIANA